MPKRGKKESVTLAEVQRQVTEIRTALYGINGTGGVVRETSRILEDLKAEIIRLRDFRHDYANHMAIFLDRVNEVNRRAAQAIGAHPFKPLAVVRKDDKERFDIVEES